VPVLHSGVHILLLLLLAPPPLLLLLLVSHRCAQHVQCLRHTINDRVPTPDHACSNTDNTKAHSTHQHTAARA
jgi:hypothetical protein